MFKITILTTWHDPNGFTTKKRHLYEKEMTYRKYLAYYKKSELGYQRGKTVRIISEYCKNGLWTVIDDCTSGLLPAPTKPK
jgi:hypothetical protein